MAKMKNCKEFTFTFRTYNDFDYISDKLPEWTSECRYQMGQEGWVAVIDTENWNIVTEEDDFIVIDVTMCGVKMSRAVDIDYISSEGVVTWRGTGRTKLKKS